MKYKLINNQTKEEYLCEKITIDIYDYYVSDDIINTGDWVLSKNSISPIFLDGGDLYSQMLNLKEWFKIIATNNPNIDIFNINDIEINYYKELKKRKKIALNFRGQIAGRHPDNFINSEIHHMGRGYLEGYNVSQKTHPFTEQDMIEFADWKYENLFSQDHEGKWSSFLLYYSGCIYTKKEILDFWRNQQIKILYYQ